MKVHFVPYETFEVPGAYLNGHRRSVGHRPKSANEALPETVDETDFLIVMGGLNAR